ncbi:hypothetical protein [Arthrobacter terricola]|nr:hypothetical protein [Arthrobacter terricola]
MFVSMPKVLSKSGIDFTVQSVETTTEHVLIRVRTSVMLPGRYHATAIFPAIAAEPLALSDKHGTSAPLFQSSSAAGAFMGIVDFAYLLKAGIDLNSPLTLESSSTRMTFQI